MSQIDTLELTLFEQVHEYTAAMSVFRVGERNPLQLSVGIEFGKTFMFLAV